MVFTIRQMDSECEKSLVKFLATIDLLKVKLSIYYISLVPFHSIISSILFSFNLKSTSLYALKITDALLSVKFPTNIRGRKLSIEFIFIWSDTKDGRLARYKVHLFGNKFNFFDFNFIQTSITSVNNVNS